MPLHSVPLFSFVSKRPKGLVSREGYDGTKTKPATPDLLYFDAHLSAANDCELADCYCESTEPTEAHDSNTEMGQLFVLFQDAR